MTYLAIKSAALLCIAVYAALRFKYELQMMQQNSYRTARYLRWLKSDLSSTVRATDLMLLAVLLLFWNNIWAIGGVGAVSILKSAKEIGRKYKKPLVFTARATRIYVVELLLLILPAAMMLLATITVSAAYAMAAAALSPLFALAALWILLPLEKLINRHYCNDARRILRSMPELTVIGITGSYGKTSTKHYMYRILSEKYNVLMTPGSYNTTLGVVRTVREQLKPYHQVFIVEMGAKQRGDVREICRLVNPKIGIITAVGEQHLESFGCIENVQAAKFELIDSLPENGTAILNDDFEMIASRKVTNVKNVYRYSATGRNADFKASDIRYGRTSSTFTVEGPDGTETPLETRLLGECNISNLLAGYITAKVMGMDETDIRYAVAQVAQVEHRLSVRHAAGGITVIDDAFNSNPHGSKMALDVLGSFTGGRRIVITPGMIELGKEQYRLNRQLGEYMCGRCDTAIVVGRYNRDAIIEGLTGGGFRQQDIIEADTFAEASARLREIVRSGDTVLYENDLPDTFK